MRNKFKADFYTEVKSYSWESQIRLVMRWTFWIWFHVTNVYPKNIIKILPHQESKAIWSGNESKFGRVQMIKSKVRKENYRPLSVSNRNVLKTQNVESVLHEKFNSSGSHYKETITMKKWKIATWIVFLW